jgi:hypothetical protein
MSDLINQNITQQYMDDTIDSLIITHILQTYNVSSINQIDLNNVTNQLDQSLIELMLLQSVDSHDIYNFEIQVLCLETPEELVERFECSICLEQIETIEKITFNCQHYMCKSCTKKCILKKTQCPFCRRTITDIEVKDPTFVHEF